MSSCVIALVRAAVGNLLLFVFPPAGKRTLPRLLVQLAVLQRARHTLRDRLHGDDLMRHAVVEALAAGNATLCLLSIRHHRRSSFDFARPGPGS
jgi:hypothetical protein